MSVVGILAIGFVFKELVQQMSERDERMLTFNEAREYADFIGKPLLVVGAPKRLFDNHPGGDVTIDIDPNVDASCEYQVADVRAIPYHDKYFGATLCSHVLEHLTVEDAIIALKEMHRVSDKVFVAGPHKSSIAAWLHPEHKSWVTIAGNGYIIQDRNTGRTIELVV